MRFAHAYSRIFLFAGLGFLIPAFSLQLETHWLIYTIGLTFFYLGSGMLLISALAVKVPRNPLSHFVGYIGLQSYSIYLWHSSMTAWWIPLFDKNFNLKLSTQGHIVVYLFASIILGVLIGLVMERPFLWIRDVLFPSHQRGL
jgi:peptidoglycan/LPS O-acetylase OafA/YrhL